MDHRILSLSILLMAGALLAGCIDQTSQTGYENKTDMTASRGSDKEPQTEQNMNTPGDNEKMKSNG